jgi:beta-N-acetylhexosaminidase
MNYNVIIDNLSLEDLVGQVLCYQIPTKANPKEVEEMVKRVKPGGIFLTNMERDQVKLYTDMVNKYAKIPVIVSSDVENGPEIAVKGSGSIPHQMAVAAANDPTLMKKAGSITAKVSRKNGIHWTYSPVVDLIYNKSAAASNIRAFGDKVDTVINNAKAFIDGAEENRYLITTCKHFPGDFMDDRNAHFVTTINDMTKEQWMESYGKIYKTMIDNGIMSIMAAHCSLPAFEDADSIHPVFGAPPAVLSYNLLTKLLKETLGFEGCIVSDAMSMIGVASRVDSLDEIAVKFLNAGGDMVLFPEQNDFDNILNAVKNGIVSIDRLKDAVKRVLKLKERARLFENQEDIYNEIGELPDIREISQEIANKSIKVVRDIQNVIPVDLKKGSKVLMLNIVEPYYHQPPTNHEFDALKDEFEKAGMYVEVYTNVNHYKVKELLDKFDVITVNSYLSCLTYHGATSRVGWNNIHLFWRGYLLTHPKLIFTSFGDPCKLYDFPYLKTYINAFSFSNESQRAVANVIMGKIKPVGKNPISFPPFFENEL